MQDCCFVCFGMFCMILFRWCSWWFWWIVACYFSLTYCLHFNKFVCGCQGLSDSHWWAVRYLHVHELLHAILVTYVTWWPWTLLLIVWRKKKRSISGRHSGRQAIWCPCLHLISSLYTVAGVWRQTQWPGCGEFDICLQSFRHKKVLLIKGAPGEGTVLRQQWVGFSGLGLIPLSTLGVGG